MNRYTISFQSYVVVYAEVDVDSEDSETAKDIATELFENSLSPVFISEETSENSIKQLNETSSVLIEATCCTVKRTEDLI